MFAIDFDSTGTAALEISADGPWRVEIKSLLLARREAGAFAGIGDDVVFYDGTSGPARLTNDGASNFAIWFYGADTDLLVNEIGPYEGTVVVRGAPGFMEINAEGGWSFTPG